MEMELLARAGGIFLLRVLGNMVITLRLVMLMRGSRLIVMLLAALESLIFAVALGSVVSDLKNLVNLLAYCTGFAVGAYLGMELEQRLIQRFVAVQVISPARSHAIAAAIRAAGFGATESWGQGAQGEVGTVRVVVGHQEVRDVVRIVQEVDSAAFVTIEELRGISHGYFRRMVRHHR